MQKNRNTVVGISLGTRSVGFAVLRAGELMDWRTVSFKGLWSPTKKSDILDRVIDYCLVHKATMVHIKEPNEVYQSKPFKGLLESLEMRLKAQAIKSMPHTIHELKTYCFGDKPANKKLLIQYVAAKHPEVLQIVVKEQTNRNRYHVKMFEAIAVVRSE